MKKQSKPEQRQKKQVKRRRTMMPGENSKYFMRIIAYLIALIGCGNFACAGGFDDKDFSLRFPAALSRFSSYADVAASGGASAGSKWQTSVNPASIAWQSIAGRYHVSFNPQYSQIIFQEGAVLHVISESVTNDFEKFGTFQAALAQVRGNK